MFPKETCRQACRPRIAGEPHSYACHALQRARPQAGTPQPASGLQGQAKVSWAQHYSITSGRKAARPGFRITAHKENSAQRMLHPSQRYTVHSWPHRGTPPQQDCRETVTRASQSPGIWDKKQEYKLHCLEL